MKRRLLTVLFALLLLLLCGCAALVPSEYTLVTPHNPGTKTEQQSDVLTVSNYKMLKNALRTLVQNGVEHGVIHTSQYEADIEADRRRPSTRSPARIRSAPTPSTISRTTAP